MEVLGIDGCRAGWLVARATIGGNGLIADYQIAVEPAIARVLESARAGAVPTALDMCIGLPDIDRRTADTAARQALGPRRSSVFAAPIRPLLGCSSHSEANLRSREISGRGLSVQTWNLMAKIAEVDRAIDPVDQVWLAETHPELAFARLAGQPLAHPKRHPTGRDERRALIGPDLPSAPPRGAAWDDVLDALALCHAALSRSLGQGRRFGDGELDSRGFRMEIWG